MEEENKIKFKCMGCGKCCSSFEDKEERTSGLPLREWEVEEFKELAKEKGVEIDIRPVDIAFDKRSGLYFFTDYKQIIEPCPFLTKEKKCSIYDKRPIVCRMYPIALNPMVFPTIDLSHFGNCPNFNAKEFIIKSLGYQEGRENRVNKKIASGEFLEAFGEEAFVNSLINSWYQAFIERTMKELISNRKVKLRKVSKTDYHKIRAIPFFEFLIKIGVMTEETKKKCIEETFSYEKNKDLTHSFLNGDLDD